MSASDKSSTFVPRTRWGRLVKMGATAAAVGTNMVGRTLGAKDSSRAEDAARVARTLSELKGAAMKVGQLASVTPGLLPQDVSEALASLQNGGQPMTEAAVREVLETNLGDSVEARFESFEWTPVGAASVGQVHRARLADGRTVAVKVQFPGVAESLDSDLDQLWAVLRLGRFVKAPARLRAGWAELRRGLKEELDYENEARNLSTFAAAVRDRHTSVAVPEVVSSHSTRRVLTMTYLDGIKLDEALRACPADERDRLAGVLVEVVVSMFHEQFFLHADPHPGNFLRLADGRLGILDWGCVRAWETEFADGWLRALCALAAGDREAFLGEALKLGFDPDIVPAENMEDVARVVAEPFLTPGDFPWGRWDPKPELQSWLRKNLGVLRGAPPPDSLFYFRTAAGIWGVLQQANARVDVHQIVSEVAARRGLTLFPADT